MYHIVIVEDELIESESLHRIVSQSVSNAEIYLARTGREAMQLIDQLSHINMMLVDINIPLPNGQQVIEYLRQQGKETRVIVITANDDFTLIRSMFNLKVDDYLLKPVKQCLLSESVRNNLRISKNEIAAAIALKAHISGLIESGDYTQWHNFLFGLMEQSGDGAAASDNGKSLAEALEVLQQYVVAENEKLAGCHEKIGQIILLLHQQGLAGHHYRFMIAALLEVSATIYDLFFRRNYRHLDFIARAKFHIERNISGNMTLDSIAEKSFVSPCYLSRTFKKNTGIGFALYITRRKIKLAKSLLMHSDLNVNAIALELAWQDANYFCRIFKKETGMAPSDFRRKRAKKSTLSTT
ncbi:helix-turn-helix domain-containing protein [Pantoea sp. CCBC3-3-1]|uniref:helix-turn-helix domain-containing protein n=1 Tax=Pantoea sp. CCBC3-3-1 TaxID=2490851 RepID=UPI0011BEFEF2